ncbi:unnamed protein product, partial [Prorocentrum cordatum]
ARASEANRAAEPCQREVQVGQEMVLELQARQAVMETHHAPQERRPVEFGVEQAERAECRASHRNLEQQAERAQRDAYQHLQWAQHDNETAELNSARGRAIVSGMLAGKALELDILEEMAAKLAEDGAVMDRDQDAAVYACEVLACSFGERSRTSSRPSTTPDSDFGLQDLGVAPAESSATLLPREALPTPPPATPPPSWGPIFIE